MSYQEYSDELYEAFDKVKDAVWYDDVVDERNGGFGSTGAF